MRRRELHLSVPPPGAALTSHLHRKKFPSGNISTIGIKANVYSHQKKVKKNQTKNQDISFATRQEHKHKAAAPAPQREPKDGTHRCAGRVGWQPSSSATAEGAPEAPIHGASSINPHGAQRWFGHDITLWGEHSTVSTAQQRWGVGAATRIH